jgi:hypothetical protein
MISLRDHRDDRDALTSVTSPLAFRFISKSVGCPDKLKEVRYMPASSNCSGNRYCRSRGAKHLVQRELGQALRSSSRTA